GVILSSKDRAFYWKTAYDEGFAEFSPGVLLTLDISRKQQDDPKTAATDSCAIAGHPMIERVWAGRLDLVDCLVAIRPEGARQLKAWLVQRDLRRSVREGAKRLLFPLLGRKHS
ncbi:MAG TPA: GNAT family N-acetyltransferase, partial [Roseiarcus sp.]|nr:GNAT family N-acetyltransferase [Roseiarcus sp.]